MFCSEVIILAAFSQAYTFTLWSFAERRFMTYDYYEIRTKRSDEKLQTAESLTKLCQVLANWPRELFWQNNWNSTCHGTFPRCSKSTVGIWFSAFTTCVHSRMPCSLDSDSGGISRACGCNCRGLGFCCSFESSRRKARHVKTAPHAASTWEMQRIARRMAGFGTFTFAVDNPVLRKLRSLISKDGCWPKAGLLLHTSICLKQT